MFAKFFDNIFFVKDRKEFQIFETKKKYDFLFPMIIIKYEQT